MEILKFSKLNRNNYSTWKIYAQSLLIKESLWSTVETGLAADADAATRERDAKAKACLYLMLEEDLINDVRDKVSAKDVWDTLQRLHTPSTAFAKMLWSKRIYRQKMTKGQCVIEHLKTMQDLFVQAELRGVEISKEQQCYILLESLDSSWDNITNSLQNLPEAELNRDLIVARILEENLRRKSEQGDSASLRTVPKQQTTPELRKQEEAASTREQRRCFYCKKIGHLQRHCKQFAAERSKQGESRWQPRQYQKQSKPPFLKDSGNKKGSATMIKEKQNDNCKWLIDSGASSSMCNNINLISNRKSANVNAVVLADGKELSTVNQMGTVYIPGLKENFNDVLHVKELENNLLSVSRLTDRDYTVIFEKNMCKIKLNGELRGIGLKKDKLYYLEDNIDSYSVENANNIDNNPIHKDCIHELHRKFGHASFKCLKKLIGY